MSRNWKIPLEGDPELTTLLTNAQASRENLCLQSEDLSTTWLNITSNDTSNAAIAPDGTTTADKLYDDSTASTVHYIAQQVTVTAATQYTFSVYCKAAEYDDVALYASAPNQGKYFNLATGAVGGNLVAAPDDAGIEDVGDGWYRCWITVTTSDTSESFRIYLTASGTSETYSGDGASGIYVWGAQLEESATPTPYIPTTTVARTITGFTPINSLVDDMHTALETVLEVEGNINDLWKRYKQLN